MVAIELFIVINSTTSLIFTAPITVTLWHQ